MNKQTTYLKDILERVSMIEQFTKEGRSAFFASIMIQESVIRCYEVIGEIVKRIDTNMLASQPHIPWKRIAGFRDFLIHSYDEIEIEVVWSAVEDDLEDLKQAVQEILLQLKEDDGK